MPHLIAYVLIALLAAVTLAWALHRRRNTPERRHNRLSDRRERTYERAMRQKDEEKDRRG